MNGIDVSHHQGTIKWPLTGVDFAIIRSSHGKHETDRCFEANYAGARKAGIPIGAYHYFYYGNKAAFDAELQNFLEHLKGKHFELPVFLDFEEEGKEYDPPLGAIDRVTLTNWAIEAFGKIRAAGLRPGLYANAYWMRKKLDMYAIPKDVCIWCADINGAIDYTGRVDIHQYDFHGTIPGISGNGVDLDRSLCSDDFLLGRVAPGWSVSRVLKLAKPMQKGSDVKALQTALADAGYPCGKADGILGPKTAAMIRAYQSANGLAIDGKAGKNTVTALGGVWK